MGGLHAIDGQVAKLVDGILRVGFGVVLCDMQARFKRVIPHVPRVHAVFLIQHENGYGKLPRVELGSGRDPDHLERR